MGLFGKIFGEKTDSETQSSPAEDAAPPARAERSPQKAAGEDSAPAAKAEAANRARARPATAGDARALTKQPENDARPVTAAPAAKETHADDPQRKPSSSAAARQGGLPKAAASRADAPAKSDGAVQAKPASHTGSAQPVEARGYAASAKLQPVRPAGAKTDVPTRTSPTAHTKQPPMPAAKREQPTSSTPQKGKAQAGVSARTDARASKDSPSPATPKAAASPPDRDAQLRVLAERDRARLEHLEQFALDLQLGCAPSPWVTACARAAEALATTAQQLELQDVQQAAAAMKESLQGLARVPDGQPDVSAREATLAAYAALAACTGGAVRALSDPQQRGEVVLRALLHPLRGVHTLTFDKLSEAGALCLDRLGTASAAELAEDTGLDAELLERVSQKVRELRSGDGWATAADARAGVAKQARRSLETLERAHARFLEAERSEDAAGKRAARLERDAQLWVLSGLLARLGSPEAADELQRGSLSQRIESARARVAQWSEG